jgi:hypothetical protein
MTESEWLVSVDAGPMLRHLAQHGLLSARKVRLSWIALCRHAWLWLDERARRAVEVVERAADADPPAVEEKSLKAAVGRLTEGEVRLDCRAVQARHLRDLFGNPFAPVTLDPAWRTPDALALASAIDEEGAFERMPYLADALEEAGCSDPSVLDHCRRQREHVRGCWLVDALLGRA